MAESRLRLERDVGLAVAAGRESGLSWTELGFALGVSAQAVQKRYGKSIVEGDLVRNGA